MSEALVRMLATIYVYYADGRIRTNTLSGDDVLDRLSAVVDGFIRQGGVTGIEARWT